MTNPRQEHGSSLRQALWSGAAPSGLVQRLGFPLLTALGEGYGWIQAARAWGCARHWLERWNAPCPVVSIGNLTVGGTGKTPLTLWLARRGQALGYSPAIVSRGYRQGSRLPVTVVSDGRGPLLSPPEAADEAALLARRLPGVPVICAPRRRLGAAWAVERLGADLLLLDDGFQHLPMGRSLDLVLLDGQHPLGNGRVVPGGPLREFPSALGRADALIFTRVASLEEGEAARRRLPSFVQDKPVMFCRHHWAGWRRLGEGEGDEIAASPPFSGSALAFCGLARPESFRAALEEQGLLLAGWIPLPDHHAFRREEVEAWSRQARSAGASALLCTEKDAVKLDPSWSDLPICHPVLEIEFLQEPTWLLERLQHLLPPGVSPS